jgi:hypothetical protein
MSIFNKIHPPVCEDGGGNQLFVQCLVGTASMVYDHEGWEEFALIAPLQRGYDFEVFGVTDPWEASSLAMFVDCLSLTLACSDPLLSSAVSCDSGRVSTPLRIVMRAVGLEGRAGSD